MVDRATLLDLDRRLAEATEGTRGLDADIWDAFGLVDEDHCRWRCSMDGRTDIKRRTYVLAWAPDYTSSLDAAVSLVERMLPGWWYLIRTAVPSNPSGARAMATIRSPSDWPAFRNWHASPALALLRALIAALLAQTEPVATSDPVPAIDADDLEDFE